MDGGTLMADKYIINLGEALKAEDRRQTERNKPKCACYDDDRKCHCDVTFTVIVKTHTSTDEFQACERHAQRSLRTGEVVAIDGILIDEIYGTSSIDSTPWQSSQPLADRLAELKGRAA